MYFGGKGRTFLKAKRLSITIVFLLVWITPSLGRAITNRFATFDLWPSTGDRYHFALNSSRNLYQFQFSANVFNTLVLHPLDIRDTSGNRLRAIVDLYFAHYISAGFGFFDFLQLDVTGILFSYAKVQDPTVTPPPGLSNVFDLGDIRIAPKLRALNANRYRFGLAFEPFVVLPLGGDANYLGDSRTNFGANIIADFLITRRFRFTLNAGGEFRTEEVLINNINFRHRLLTGLGLAAELGRGFTASLEAQANTALRSLFSDKNTTPVEFIGGVKWAIGDTGFAIGAGGGSCAVCGAKAGIARGFLSLNYRFQNDTFRQKDKEQEELLDTLFKPKQTEEQYAEEMLTLRENCPTDPKDFNSDMHDVRCPKYYELSETASRLSNCPENPEDFDPKVHDVGCEKVFTLLGEYSDKDRYTVIALKGSDQDGDGILDDHDECPKESEDMNGVADEDGCPEGGITVTDSQIWTSSPVHFAFSRSDISKKAAETLSHLAGALYFHRDVKQLYVIGHTDNIGAPQANKNLSKTRAKVVISYLKKCGAPEDIELTPLGKGEASPIASNATEEGRQQNRRVIFSKSPDNGSTPSPLTPQEMAPPPAPSSPPVNGEVSYIEVVSPKMGWLRVRENPAKNAREVARLNHGDRRITYQQSNGWYQVEYATGKTGWVSEDYVRPIAPPTAPQPVSPAQVLSMP